MFCPSCNASNREDAKFCKSCGRPLNSSRDNVSEQAQAAPAPVAAEQVNDASTATPEGHNAPVETAQPSEQPYDEAVSAEDLLLEPTLVLSPEAILAYRNRLWKQAEGSPVQQSTSSAPLPDAVPHSTETPDAVEPDAGIDQAELPTLPAINTPNTWGELSPAHEEHSLASETESRKNVVRLFETPYTDQMQDIPPPPPPSDTVLPTTTSEEELEPKEENVAMAEQNKLENETSLAEETPESPISEEPEQSMAPSAEQPLNAGDLLVKRYEIVQMLSESPEERTYQVIDHQGYQHCWNCGSQENSEGDEFCMACGASMLDIPYILHEYSARMDNSGIEAGVLQGTIVNTFMDQGRTYAVEQPSPNQSAFPNGPLLLAATNSDAGNIRRSDPNEDSTLILQLHRVHESLSTPSGIFIVADGLGGHDDGQLASRMTVNVIAERMARDLLGAPLRAEKEGESVQNDEDALTSLLQGTIEDANLAICQKNQQDKTDMGSTLTGFMIVGEHAYVVNVGDSRTYMVRGEQIYQLTTDHSLVGQLVAGGLIEPDDVYTHPQRSQIFRSLGDKPNVQVDIFKQQLHPGDILLSCSDGLWEMVRNPQIESILNNAADPQTACAQLIETANTNGGEDNVSAVVVFVR